MANKILVLIFASLLRNTAMCQSKGEMAEWSIAAVLKTVEGNTSGGSNPSLSAENESSNKKVLDYQLVATKMGRLSPPHFCINNLLIINAIEFVLVHLPP